MDSSKWLRTVHKTHARNISPSISELPPTESKGISHMIMPRQQTNGPYSVSDGRAANVWVCKTLSGSAAKSMQLMVAVMCFIDWCQWTALTRSSGWWFMIITFMNTDECPSLSALCLKEKLFNPVKRRVSCGFSGSGCIRSRKLLVIGLRWGCTWQSG